MVNDIQENKHILRDQLCYYTNELYPQNEIVKYRLHSRGYGSIYDESDFTIQLHKNVAQELDCKGTLKADWFNNALMKDETLCDGHCYTYKHEYRIQEFIDGLIVENREYVENCTNTFFPPIEREDWIKENK